jgi:predicted metal-dependent peptidase
MEMAGRLGGKVPASLEDELGKLIAPKITWQDVIRRMITQKRKGVGKADWNSPKVKPLFAGLFVPRKKDHFIRIHVAYDCSGSMDKEQIAFGISQLQVIDDRSEMTLVPFDAVVYWDKALKIRKADMENLSNAKVYGRGGTLVSDFFNEYEENIGKTDLIIVITDSFLGDGELNGIKVPPKNVETLWLVTSHNPTFKPKIGRVLHLMNERL